MPTNCIWFISLICRNIKLQNILLDKDCHCKLGDFGSCKLGTFYGMKTGTFGGTVPYLAPEVIITVCFTVILAGANLGIGRLGSCLGR